MDTFWRTRVQNKPQPKLYYIQDARSYVGNSILWWGPNSGGYTTDICKAGKYPEPEAKVICDNRDTDIAWPCDYIDGIVSKHVDMQNVKTRMIKRWKPL